jgi:hypothetical protein
VDDLGGLQKTLSVENSFRRGTVTTQQSVLAAMEDLYRRLPRLLWNRSQWSSDSARSYPLAIRLTVRSAQYAPGSKRRAPSVTRSQQKPFRDGKLLLSGAMATENERSALLRDCLGPLLQSIIFSGTEFDITRINICLANFQDIPTVTTPVVGAKLTDHLFSRNVKPARKRQRSEADLTE